MLCNFWPKKKKNGYRLHSRALPLTNFCPQHPFPLLTENHKGIYTPFWSLPLTFLPFYPCDARREAYTLSARTGQRGGGWGVPPLSGRSVRGIPPPVAAYRDDLAAWKGQRRLRR